MTTEPIGLRRLTTHATVRARVLGAVVALAALGMAVAGGTAYVLERQRVDQRVDDSLTRTVEEFRTLATLGVDPQTGEGFTTVREVLRTALQRTVPAPNEGMFGLIDGQVELVPLETVARFRVEDVAEVVDAAVVATAAAEPVVAITSVATDGTTVRYVAVPVRVEGDPAVGAFVLGFDREAEHRELVETYRTFALVGLAALVALAIAGWLVAGRALAPLRLLAGTAQRVTESDLSERISVTGDDDVSELARTVNSMLDRLERAFGAQRRLLDDAGHELRTPLTIVRGHLELMDTQDPDDVRATQALVLDEVDRMHRLVDDLVVLATVDRPDFVSPAPTAVGPLTDEVLDKARSLADRVWLVDRRADVVAQVDAQRLTQAWLQLAANAAKFSPAGSTVRLGSAVEGGRLLLTVTDEGPGVAPQDAERIFDRFARGVAGRGVEGSGLGLPIVRAIAQGHGGRAWVERAPGGAGGARFTIAVPLTAAAAGGAEHVTEGAR